MSKLIKCKTCGAEVAKSAKTCPSCGAKLKKTHPILGGIILVIGILIFISAFSGNTSTDKDDKNVKTDYEVGETATMNDVSVTLFDVSENNGGNYMTPENGNVFVVCEFEIQNDSSDEIAVSSLMSFNAYIDDYSTNISLTGMLSSSKSQLDGTIAPGKKMNGVVGYEAPADWNNIEIRYTPNFWNGKEMKFSYSKA